MSDAPGVEVHVERLLGRRVRDANGVVIGRIEELCVEIVDGDPVVTEFHVGSAALFERIGSFVHQLPFFSLLPWTPAMYCVSSADMDLEDVRHPRVRRRRAELARLDGATSSPAAPP